MDEREPGVEDLERAWVVVDPVRERSRLIRDVGKFGLESAEPSDQGLEPRVEAGQALRLMEGHARHVAGAGAIGGQGVMQRLRPARDRFAVLGGDQPSADLLALTWSELRRGDLSRFVLEDVEPTDHLARVERGGIEGVAILAPAGDRVGNRRADRRMASECVEQVPLPALVEQPSLVVLTVDLDQWPDLLRQPRRGHGGVVEPGRGTAGRGDLTNRDERLRCPVEQRLDPRRVGAVADQGRVRPRPQCEPQGVDQQALAGTRLAGDDVQPRRERQPQPVDQREVVDGELEQPAGSVRRAWLGHDGSSATLCRRRSQNG